MKIFHVCVRLEKLKRKKHTSQNTSFHLFLFFYVAQPSGFQSCVWLAIWSDYRMLGAAGVLGVNIHINSKTFVIPSLYTYYGIIEMQIVNI